MADVPPPRLVVLFVVDQCRPDYFERFAPRFTGFFARLREQGRWFTEGEQHHAFTVTAAGHAALGTGRFPAQNGIVGNDFFDAASGRNVNATSDPAAKAVGGLGGGHSGHRLRCDALGDWWKAAHPDAKVVGVALKPRSAILPLGRGSHSAWWFDEGKGTFVSSTRCVGETLPEWAARFADGRPCDRFPSAWEATLEEADYEALGCTVDDEPTEAPSGTRPTRTFPHALDERDLARRASALAVSPFGDELVLDFARAAVEGESFGDDAVPDLLTVGLSSTDLIGHRHGPDSREIAEQLLALDRALARFVAFLETRVGAGEVLFALSSDHGIPSLPAVARARRREGDWIDWTTLEPSVRAALAAIDPALEKAAISLPNTSLRLDRALLAAAGREVEPVARALAAALRQTPPFRDARSHAELQEPLAPDDRIGPRLRATSEGDRAGDLLFVLPPGTIYLAGGARVASVTKGLATSHGTAWDDDTRVPLVFLGAGVAPAQINGRAFTVDVAPTLARAIGLPLPADLDGVALPLH
ncbi:MAG: alkaline phosphatase family protein [Planctomycetes bacterium]|nr:alkaline phosphatase family protein [Planctomycetota bacterium]